MMVIVVTVADILRVLNNILPFYNAMKAFPLTGQPSLATRNEVTWPKILERIFQPLTQCSIVNLISEWEIVVKIISLDTME